MLEAQIMEIIGKFISKAVVKELVVTTFIPGFNLTVVLKVLHRLQGILL